MVSGKLFASDFEDGSLEQLCLAPQPLAILGSCGSAGTLAWHGVFTVHGFPPFCVLVGLPTQALPVLFMSLLLGSLCLTLIGAVGSALDCQHPARRSAALGDHHSTSRTCFVIWQHGGSRGCSRW